jgi:CrcB protein
MTSTEVTAAGLWLCGRREVIMLDVFLVGLGGFAGSALRYVLSKAADTIMPMFPLGTLIVNMLSSLIAGVLLGLYCASTAVPEVVRLFGSIGFCGGLSTFSAFSAETFTLIQEQDYISASVNAVLNLAVSLVCVALGFGLTNLCIACFPRQR